MINKIKTVFTFHQKNCCTLIYITLQFLHIMVIFIIISLRLEFYEYIIFDIAKKYYDFEMNIFEMKNTAHIAMILNYFNFFFTIMTGIMI